LPASRAIFILYHDFPLNIVSTALMASTDELVMPAAYPEPSPMGYIFFTDSDS
jgi:hypothetical protein